MTMTRNRALVMVRVHGQGQNNTPMSTFDPLDMNNYKVEKLPKMQKSNFEKWMARLGGPLAIIAFVVIYWCCHIGFIDNLNTEMLTEKALKRCNDIGFEEFLRTNYAMLARKQERTQNAALTNSKFKIMLVA